MLVLRNVPGIRSKIEPYFVPICPFNRLCHITDANSLAKFVTLLSTDAPRSKQWVGGTPEGITIHELMSVLINRQPTNRLFAFRARATESEKTGVAPGTAAESSP